jgi:copper chaperone CopZ
VEVGILIASMTKVTLHYDLARPLSEPDLENIANVHSTYGIARVQVAPSLDKITVDYDASRLSKRDVEAELLRHGIPIQVNVLA